MTIDEAIEIITKVREIADPNGKKGYWEALGLGIEALELIEDMRDFQYWGRPTLLPGETEE